MTLNDIKDRCVIDDDTGCWTWKGALSAGKWPRIWAPDHTQAGSPMKVQTGRRAVWHLHTGVAIPEGFRVYGTCACRQCLNPEHMACGPAADWGAHMSASGRYQGSIARKVASRSTGRRRSVVSEDALAKIRQSHATGRELARELGISEQTVSRARNGQLLCFQPLGSPFAGLGARA